MSDPTNFTLAQARDAVRAKKVSSVELTKAFIGAMEAARPLNAFVTETPERALEMAKASDARIAKGEGGALEGLPLAIKDLFCTKGVRTTAGGNILSNFVPPYEATVSQNLWDAGAVMLGKTNMDEFAMGSSNETSHFGPVINPWRAKGSNRDLVPGGSSGGSAAAVAADLCLAATGTDTGGSIRVPAAVTGTVGLKPTYGRCSRYGIVAFASSLDQAGPMTKTVRDAAILMRAMASVDPKDSTSVDMPVPDYEEGLEGSLKGLRVGIPREHRVNGLEEQTADPISMYLNDVFTVTVNLAGLPALALPAGVDLQGLPLGLQIIGRAFDEATVLRAGHGIERNARLNAKPAKWWRAA
jgi:aspartyl-tRNA(Asn)/glutamyl-tRNA(Gln) amidotransferase subunit A